MQPIQTLNGWIEPELTSISGDRRSKPRHALQLALRYRVLGEEGAIGYGTTRDINSGGVAFDLQETLPPGARVELIIDWPVALRGSVPLQLVVDGRIAWCGNGVAAIRTSRCQFCQRAKIMTAGGSELP